MKHLGLFILFALFLLSGCGAKRDARSAQSLPGGNNGKICTMEARVGIGVSIEMPVGVSPAQVVSAFQVIRTSGASNKIIEPDFDQPGTALRFSDWETPAGTYVVSIYYNNQRVSFAPSVPVRSDGCHPQTNNVEFGILNGQVLYTGQTY